MSTIIIISPPPPPPPPEKRATKDSDREARAKKTTAYNTALRALNDAFNDGVEIRVIDA